jgi:hypothetical protein
MSQYSSLQLFLCVRWGHAESPEGADGEDTHFVVRAHDHVEAAELADVILNWLPTQVEGNPRGVEARCHRVLELGIDTTGSLASAVVIGPAIGYALRSDSENYKSWCRGEAGQDPNAWLLTSEVFG